MGLFICFLLLIQQNELSYEHAPCTIKSYENSTQHALK
jgi:hypothetical protein